MMNMNLAEGVVVISADLSRLDADLKTANRKIDAFVKGANSRLAKVALSMDGSAIRTPKIASAATRRMASAKPAAVTTPTGGFMRNVIDSIRNVKASLPTINLGKIFRGQDKPILQKQKKEVELFNVAFNRNMRNLTPTINLSSFNNKLNEGRGLVSSFVRFTAKAFSGGFAFAGGAMLARQIGQIGSAVASLPMKFIENAGMMEGMKNTLESVMGNARDAAIMQARVIKMAAVTPFSVKSLTGAVTTMKAFSFESEKTLKMLRIVGDAAAIQPEGMQAAVGTFSLVLGQIKGAGKLLTQDMRQLQTRGIDVKGSLAEAFGTDQEGVNKMIASGQITIDDAIDAIVEGMDKKFGGAMERQSKTFTGLMSTIADVTEQVSAKIGRPFYELATLRLKNLVEWTETDSFARIVSAMERFNAELFKAIDKATVFTGKMLGLENVNLDNVSKGVQRILAVMEEVVQSPGNIKTAFTAGFNYVGIQAVLAAGKFTKAFIDAAVKAGIAIYEVFKTLLTEKVPRLFAQMAGGAEGVGQSMLLGALDNSFTRDFAAKIGQMTSGGSFEDNRKMADFIFDSYTNKESAFRRGMSAELDRNQENPDALGQALGAAVAKIFGNEKQNTEQTANALEIAGQDFQKAMAEILRKSQARQEWNELIALDEEMKRDELEKAKFSEEEKKVDKKVDKKAEEAVNARFMDTVGLNKFFQEQFGKDDEQVELAKKGNEIAKENLEVNKKIERKVGKPTVAVHGA